LGGVTGGAGVHGVIGMTGMIGLMIGIEIGSGGQGTMPVMTQQASAAELESPPMITVVADAMRFMIVSSQNRLDKVEWAVRLTDDNAHTVPSEEKRQY
jgi:hypothetical protein